MPQHVIGKKIGRRVWRVEISFLNGEERDAYIAEHFPKRKCTDAPGVYKLPDGLYLSVFLYTIRFTTKDWSHVQHPTA